MRKFEKGMHFFYEDITEDTIYVGAISDYETQENFLNDVIDNSYFNCNINHVKTGYVRALFGGYRIDPEYKRGKGAIHVFYVHSSEVWRDQNKEQHPHLLEGEQV